MSIQRLTRRLKWIKYATFTLWVFAVVTVLGGVFAFYGHLTSGKNLSAFAKITAVEIRELAELKSLTHVALSAEDATPLRTSAVEQIKIHPGYIKLKTENAWELGDGNFPTPMIYEIQGRIDEGLLNRSEKLAEAHATLETTNYSLFALGLLTVIFGLVIPFYMLKTLISLSLSLKSQISENAAKSMANWIASQEKFGDEAFKNPRFWSEIVAAFLEQYAPLWESPGSATIAEVAKTVRQELQRLQEASPPKTDDKDSKSHLKVA